MLHSTYIHYNKLNAWLKKHFVNILVLLLIRCEALLHMLCSKEVNVIRTFSQRKAQNDAKTSVFFELINTESKYYNEKYIIILENYPIASHANFEVFRSHYNIKIIKSTSEMHVSILLRCKKIAYFFGLNHFFVLRQSLCFS